MALLQFPASVKFAEVRMGIKNSGNADAVSEVNFRGLYGAQYRELWRMELAVTPMSHAAALSLEMLLEQASGRANNLRVPMSEGVHTRACAAAASVNTATTRGADTVALDISTATLTAGTLIAIGDITETEYQVFEVLADAAVGTGAEVSIAPRCRYAFATDAPVTVAGDVEGRFQLADDGQGAPRFAVNGAAYLNLNLVEAP